jgi:alkylation response protein AidB-like acyl-CoA dehydrogenase
LECGTPEQIERWMRPSMLGELHWCQLYSEPSAGSDLAALKTRAVKTEGGWLVTGQKVWTSDAQHADVGLALVRTDSDAKKHEGISVVVMDLKASGVDIRPLRQINGEAHFNEVFLDEVFVPDDNVVGPVNGGWSVTRTSLGHERVSLGASTSNWTSGPGWDHTLVLTAAAAEQRPELLKSLGQITLTAEGAAALHLRSAYRALLGQPAGIEGTISKTVVADLAQKVGDYSLDLMGEYAAFADGEQYVTALMFLQVRMATIAGGTSEVLRNLLAEQALGLPREPAHN